MHIQRLFLHHFRNYREAAFEFCPGVNCLYGENAQGKTNLLEAIYFLITGRSFRTNRLSELIYQGEQAFYIEALFSKHGVEQTLKVCYDGKKHTIVCNSTQYDSPAHLLGLLQGVLLSPEDSELIKGPPSFRRQFLDLQLVQTDPLYHHHLNRYHRAMKQRNCLLRARCERTIESWEHEMSHSAAYLADCRFELASYLTQASPPIQEHLSLGRESLKLNYLTTLANESIDTKRLSMLDQLRKLRQREMFLGYTIQGPHKDDLLIAIGDQEARHYASEGQQRCCVAALRLTQWQVLHNQIGEKPLMLVDDMGIGLDKRRCGKLAEYLGTLGQVFTTSPDSFLNEQGKRFEIMQAAYVYSSQKNS